MAVRNKLTNKPAYMVEWKSAVVSATDVSNASALSNIEGIGQFRGVSGTIYRNGLPSAVFSADHGTADNAKGVLTLEGAVKLTAVDGNTWVKGTALTCDHMSYATSDEIIKAKGSVEVRSPDYTMGTLPEAWCSSDLTEVSSPSKFSPVRHNQPAKRQP